MKKVFVFLLLICALTLIACSNENNNPKKEPENDPQQEIDPSKKAEWPESDIQSYCGNKDALPKYTGASKDLKPHKENNNLYIDIDGATDSDYSNYCKDLLSAGYESNNLPSYIKSFDGFKIQVDVYFDSIQNKLSLVITKEEIISNWPTKQITEVIGEEACKALPIFEGPYDYNFSSDEWFTCLTISGNNIIETYNAYIDNLENSFILYEDFNEEDYKEYRFEYTNSKYDTVNFDLIYDGDYNEVRISMSYEMFESPVEELPNACHIKFNLENKKQLDIYKSGDDYAFINYSKVYKVEYYKYNAINKTYAYYVGESESLDTVNLSENKKINYKEFIAVFKDYIYDDRSRKALNFEIDSELNDTICEIPCEAHISNSYRYYIDPNTKLLCKLCTSDYIFRELALFENSCNFPFNLPE